MLQDLWSQINTTWRRCQLDINEDIRITEVEIVEGENTCFLAGDGRANEQL